jgi:hypothetical protein
MVNYKNNKNQSKIFQRPAGHAMSELAARKLSFFP